MQTVSFSLNDKPGMINAFPGQLTSARALSDSKKCCGTQCRVDYKIHELKIF